MFEVRDLRSDQLRILLRRHTASLLDNISNNVALRDAAPEMDAHRLLAVE